MLLLNIVADDRNNGSYLLHLTPALPSLLPSLPPSSECRQHAHSPYLCIKQKIFPPPGTTSETK